MAHHHVAHRASATRTTPKATTASRPTPSDWGRFSAWAAAGAALTLGSISWLGPGPILGLAALATLVFLAATRRLRRVAFGLPLGAGVVALLVAWLNRQGPGTVYWRTATASGADQYLDPRPWLLAGVALVTAGLVGFVLARGAREDPPKVEHPT